MEQRVQESFKCIACGREFRWRHEIAGRTLRCRCGVKVRCPAVEDETVTAAESLEDTVADVELDEALDDVDTGDADGGAPGSFFGDEPGGVAIKRPRGVFGLTLGGEVILYAVGSLAGGACAILSVVTVVWRHYEYFWPYIVGAVLLGPLCWVRFYKRWGAWAGGRTWLECLSDVLGDEGGERGC